MRYFDNAFAIFLLVMPLLASCPSPENPGGNGDMEIYIATYEIEYMNKTDLDIDLLTGVFVSPSENPIVPSSNRSTLKKNSIGSLIVSWPYTWYFFVREEDPGFQNRRDAISSFYLQLLVNGKDYMIAGWPEAVYSQDNILSYGHGYGMDASSIGILHNGELQVYTFDDPTHLMDQNIDVKAKLTINDEDSFVFEITEFPHRR